MTDVITMTLLPQPGVCQVCARDHPDHMPHDATTMFYSVKFMMDNNRNPTWHDAMAHCSEEIKAAWIKGLIDHGVDVEGGKLLPP